MHGTDSPDLHREPLDPFTTLDTLRSAGLLGLASLQLGAWLAVFWLLRLAGLSRRRLDQVARFACRCVLRQLGVRVRPEGLEGLEPGASYVFCPNHVSSLDSFVVYRAVPHFFRSFQSASHFKYPVYGRIIGILGQLPVDPRDKELTRRSYGQAARMLAEGDCFVVLPEGHRSRDGRLGGFYPGAFRLAIEAQVPVVPLALKGLRNLNPPGDWRLRPGRVTVRFGAPIPTRGLSLAEVPDLSERTRGALNALLAEDGRGACRASGWAVARARAIDPPGERGA